MTIRVPFEDLTTFSDAVLRTLRVDEEDANVIARCLVEADLRGVSSHGVMRLPIYAPRFRSGAINPRPRLRIERKLPVAALVDGDNGLGHLVGTKAMELAMEMADASGAGIVSAVNSNHFGAAGVFTSRAAEAGLVAMSMSNTCPAMPAVGGRAAVVGNGPISFALPAGDGVPVCLDISTSAGAYGKILLAAKAGEPIPEGWAADEEGRPTTDAEAAIASQLLLPFAGHKGFGLSFIIDTLCAALGNAPFGDDIPNTYLRGQEMAPGRNSHVFVAFRCDMLVGRREFLAKVDAAKRFVLASPTAPGVDRVYFPGEREWIARCEQVQNGVALSRPVADELARLGSDAGVPAPWA